RPVAYRDPHHPHAAPGGAAEPGDTVCLNAAYHIVGGAVVIAILGQEANQPLIDRRRCHDFGAGKASDTLDQPGGVGAAAIHDLPDSRAAERAQGSIGGKSATATRPLRIPVLLIAKPLLWNRIARVLRKGRAVSRCMRDENETRVERQVQPFMP